MNLKSHINNISIVYKLSGIISFLVIISMVFVGFFTYSNNKLAILNRTYEQLTSVRYEKTQRLTGFLNNKIGELHQFGDTSPITAIISCLNEDEEIISMENFNTYIGEYLVKQGEVDRFIFYKSNSFYTIDPYKQDLGIIDIELNNQEHYFDEINKSHDTIVTDLVINELNEKVFYIFISLDCENNIYIGFEISVKQINNIMLEENPYNGLGKSGEVYIVGKDKLLRSQSRFITESILKISVPYDFIDTSFNKKNETNILRDYRDILVLTSYGGIKWGGDFWVVFAEIDYEEAMEPVYAFRTSLIYLGFIGSVLFIALIMLLIFTITKPVSILKAASIEISNSNYSVRVPVNNNDEIGQLSSSFNFMATKIEEQRKILDKEKKKRLQTMIDWQEQERRRLSRELHDGVGQLLLSAKFRIGRINGKSNNDNEIIDDTLNILQQTVDDIKSISNDLMPSILLEFGLNKAVEDIINNISNTNKIIITFDIQLNKEPKERTSMYIYRIVQEIYNNIVKHSLAKKSELVLNENNDNIELIVSDDGIGFDLDNARTSKSHGIRNIRERVNLLNGEIKIVSKKGEGTKISIIIPKNY